MHFWQMLMSISGIIKGRPLLEAFNSPLVGDRGTRSLHVAFVRRGT